MKKFKLLALAFVIGTAGLFAANESTPDVPKKVIRAQIVDLLETPDFSIEKDMSIAVTFTFNSEGEIVVLKVDSRDRDVLNYVREYLNGKSIETPGERDKHYVMQLTMKTA